MAAQVSPGRQAYGKKWKQALSKLVFQHEVRVEVVDVDRYQRSVAWVYVGGQNVNEAQVRAGLAWWYAVYAPDDDALRALEAEAMQAGRGLWRGRSPTPPWEFRKANRIEDRGRQESDSPTRRDKALISE